MSLLRGTALVMLLLLPAAAQAAAGQVLFALGRTPGWLAQWEEMITDKEQKIARPRQIYTGAAERPFLPVERRS